MNDSMTALICLTDGEARAAARIVYLNTRYTCQLIKFAAGTAVTIPGLESKKSNEVFASLFAGSINAGCARLSKLRRCTNAVAAATA